jgi:hypothetical protein
MTRNDALQMLRAIAPAFPNAAIQKRTSDPGSGWRVVSSTKTYFPHGSGWRVVSSTKTYFPPATVTPVKLPHSAGGAQYPRILG